VGNEKLGYNSGTLKPCKAVYIPEGTQFPSVPNAPVADFEPVVVARLSTYTIRIEPIIQKHVGRIPKNSTISLQTFPQLVILPRPVVLIIPTDLPYGLGSSHYCGVRDIATLSNLVDDLFFGRAPRDTNWGSVLVD
jgi:hypothetical protein